MKPKLILVLGLMGLAAAIFAENLVGGELNTLFLRFPGIDKLLHTLEYALVTVCVYTLARRTTLATDVNVVRITLTVAIAIAVLDESLQRLFPARSVEAFDFVANLAGIILGWLFVGQPAPRVRLAAGALALATSSVVTYHTHATLIDYSRAMQYERKHDFVRAREHYLLAFAAGLRSPALFNELAWVEVESGVGDPRKAVEYARQAIEMQPASADVLDTYGWALHSAGRHVEALESLQQAYRRKPGIFCIHYHLGAVYLALGKPAEAAEHFRKQLELPETREARMAALALARMDESHTGPKGHE